MELIVLVVLLGHCLVCSWHHALHCHISTLEESGLTFNLGAFRFAPLCYIWHSLLSCESSPVPFLQQILVLILKLLDHLVQILILLPILAELQLHILKLSAKAQSIVVLHGILIPPKLNLPLLSLDHIFQGDQLLPTNIQLLLIPDCLHQFGVKSILIKAKPRLILLLYFYLELVNLVQQHLVLFLQFLLAQILAIMLAFQFLDGLPEPDDFLFLLGDGFKVIRPPD